MICFRREGIRIEQYSNSDGVVYSFTLENYLASWEGILRAWFVRGLGFKLVLIPQAQLAAIGQRYGRMPYRFAIAVDATSASNGTGLTLTYSHTCTGSNLILVSTGYLNTGASLDDVSGITYATVAETLINKLLASGDYTYLFNLVAPATGANNVVVSITISLSVLSESVSYSGAAQSGQPDSQNATKVDNSGTSLTTSTTVVASNCWLVGHGRWDAGGIGAGTGTTFRKTQANTGSGFFDSNGTVGTGSQSLQITGTALSGGTSGVLNIASIAPAAGVVVVPKLTLLGAG